MSVDLAALAHSVRTLPDVRSCVLLSRDGLVLAAEPESAEVATMAFWSQLARVGEVEKGFLKTDANLWVFSQRGPYQVIVLADPSARPGIVLGALEQALLAGEQVRQQEREALRAVTSRPADAATPQGPRFRAPLHRDSAPAGQPKAEPAPQGERAPVPVAAVTESADGAQGAAAASKESAAKDAEWEVDVVQLAREFGALYSEGT